MRRSTDLAATAVFALVLTACHGQSTFTQTFESQETPGQTLTLSSDDGFLKSEAGFPNNVMDWLLGSDDVSGSYVLTTKTETTEGRFRLVKEANSRFLEFTSPAHEPWRLHVETGGLLVDSDDIVWRLKASNAKSVTGFTLGK